MRLPINSCGVWTVNDALERIDMPGIEVDIHSRDIYIRPKKSLMVHTVCTYVHMLILIRIL